MPWMHSATRRVAACLGATVALGRCSAEDTAEPVRRTSDTLVVSPLRAKSLSVGQSATLTGESLDAEDHVLANRLAMWSSNSPAVASISASALVMAVSPGSITARSGTTTGTATITVRLSEE